MTSLTEIRDDESPSITVSPKHTVADINPMIYGGFTEHMGRCIYGGIYDPSNKHGLIDADGFRTDVIACMKELRVPVVRYPGGNFCAQYRWQDGIGPRDLRPKRPDLAWGLVESNQFGTDEFMKWCGVVGAEPFLCLNMGTGTLEEALAWLEYCNSEQDTHYANLRRKNGREEPYKVKYWALGNETWGPWQVEQNTKEDYAKKAYQWGKALKFMDPSITLVLCGKNGYSDWDRHVLQHCLRYTDMHSIHLYVSDAAHLPNVTSPLAAERAIQITASLIDLARIETNTDVWPETPSTKPRTEHRPKICFDEWNIWSETRFPGSEGAEQHYDLSDALGVAVWLNVFVRQAQWLGMATIAQSVNVLAPIYTTRDGSGLVRQTIYWPLYLFARYMRGRTIAVGLRCGVYGGRTNPEWIASTLDAPWLDVAAALDADGVVNLAVVNISEERAFETDVEGVVVGGKVEVYIVGGEGHGVRDCNIDEPDKVRVRESEWDGKGKFTFQKHSFTLLRWKAETDLTLR